VPAGRFEKSTKESVSIDDPVSARKLLLLAPIGLVPRLDHKWGQRWDVLAIAEYLAELFPESGNVAQGSRGPCALPVESPVRCSPAFYNLRSALPMNLKSKYKNFNKIFAGAPPG